MLPRYHSKDTESVDSILVEFTVETKTRRRWPRRVLLGVLLIVATVVALAPVRTIRWDGGFSDEEYRLTFTRADGRPVEGVSLQVQTHAGGVSYLYPVNEYLPDSTPITDATGRMEFHHLHLTTIEYGGRDIESLIGIPLRRDHAPKYNCVFFHNGLEVTRVPFNDLRLKYEYDQAPNTRKTWRETEWPAREFLAHLENWETYCRELFDSNHDGRLDREEAIPHRIFASWPESRRPSTREVEFRIRERTVVIDVP